MSNRSRIYNRLREKIESIPVIDCHEHTIGPQGAPEYREPLAALLHGYFHSDFASAGGESLLPMLSNQDVPTEKKWKVFEPIWRRTQFTAYAEIIKRVLRKFYGEEELTLDALLRMKEKLLNLRDESVYWGILDEVGIRCRLCNIWIDLKDYIEGRYKVPPRDRMLVPLPGFHQVKSFGEIQQRVSCVSRDVTSLMEYLDACREVFTRMKERGTIGFKDQSAYGRIIQYDMPSEGEAERLFNFALEDPRRSLGWPESKPLDDYLFHAFMRMARDLELPVQIHTGHMAGTGNDIAKTNVAHLRSVLETHRKVRFDIFHGNWPYAGELLYTAKNYPNVAIDCCWVHIIDPRYTTRLLADALVTVPHGKIHGFGGDFRDIPEFAVAHLDIARDNIARALASHVKRGWLGEAEAVQVAADWLFNNPNEFFGLGLERFEA